jgi:hypothetical protein
MGLRAFPGVSPKGQECCCNLNFLCHAEIFRKVTCTSNWYFRVFWWKSVKDLVQSNKEWQQHISVKAGVMYGECMDFGRL